MREALCFNDVLLVPQHWSGGSRSEIDISTTVGGLKLNIPIISANMASLTEEKMAICLAKKGGLGIVHRLCSIERECEMVANVKKEGCVVGASIGIGDDAIDRAKKLMDAGVDLICLDVAFFAQDKAHEVAMKFLSLAPNFPFIVGNISGRNHLWSAGRYPNLSYKVGIGSSLICSTRIQTGCGLPTLASLFDIQLSGHRQINIISDGGNKTSGDCVKSLAAGANSVMLGGMLAASSETPGEVFEKDGKLFKRHYGNASEEAKRKAGLKTNHIEGVSVDLPYKGDTGEIIDSIVEGIKSGLSYCGAHNLKELTEKAEFVKISSSGYVESTPYAKHM